MRCISTGCLAVCLSTDIIVVTSFTMQVWRSIAMAVLYKKVVDSISATVHFRCDRNISFIHYIIHSFIRSFIRSFIYI